MEDLRIAIGTFIAERDWAQFHSPKKNQAMAFSVLNFCVIVKPVLVPPLRRKWDSVREEVDPLASMRTCKTLEVRFRALLIQDETRQLDLECAQRIVG